MTGRLPELDRLRGGLRQDDNIKQIDICLDDTDGYTLCFRMGNPSRFEGTIKLCAPTEAFVDVESGDRILLTITRLNAVLLCMEVEISLDAWNTFSYKGFEYYQDNSLSVEEWARWAR